MKRFASPGFLAAILASAGMWLFAYFIHTIQGLAIAGLVITALCISIYSGGFINLIRLTGLYEYRKNLFPFSVAGLLSGVLLGMLYREVYSLPLLPLSLTLSAIAAPAIGITEELVFRGFIQGTITKSPGWLGIILAAGSHTIYKFLVIRSFPVHLDINLLYLVLLTFSAGIFFGWLREKTENTIPSAIAHGCFDIMIYGSFSILPVWVWG